MLPFKWKLYRISNYVLLIAGAFLFVKFIEISVFFPRPGFEVYSFSIVILFLFMIIQSATNLYIMAKTFPNKLLTHGRYYWHLFATFSNGIIILSFCYFMFFELLPIIRDTDAADPNAFLGVVLIMFFLLGISVFVFFCQLDKKRFLQRNHATVLKSMIDSIGNE